MSLVGSSRAAFQAIRWGPLLVAIGIASAVVAAFGATWMGATAILLLFAAWLPLVVVVLLPPLMLSALAYGHRTVVSRPWLRLPMAVTVSVGWTAFVAVLIDTVEGEPSRASPAGIVVGGALTGAIVWQSIGNEQRRSRRRILDLLAVVITLAGLVIAGSVLLRNCEPIPPRELPTGAPPGTPQYDVAGALVVRWGQGVDRVEQWVDTREFEPTADTMLSSASVRGQPGVVYATDWNGEERLGLSWTEHGCKYAVFFDRSLSVQQIIDYSRRW